jgi:hypothetical protein
MGHISKFNSWNNNCYLSSLPRFLLWVANQISQLGNFGWRLARRENYCRIIQEPHTLLDNLKHTPYCHLACIIKIHFQNHASAFSYSKTSRTQPKIIYQFTHASIKYYPRAKIWKLSPNCGRTPLARSEFQILIRTSDTQKENFMNKISI